MSPSKPAFVSDRDQRAHQLVTLRRFGRAVALSLQLSSMLALCAACGGKKQSYVFLGNDPSQAGAAGTKQSSGGTSGGHAGSGSSGSSGSGSHAGTGGGHAGSSGATQDGGVADSGTVSNGKAVPYPEPTMDAPRSLVYAVAPGRDVSCAIVATDRVICWGSSKYGQLGAPHSQWASYPYDAAEVAVGGPVSKLSVGEDSVCVLRKDGGVVCWGSGPIGYAGKTMLGDMDAPVTAGDVALGGKAIDVSTYGTHSCAVLDTGSVRCWGSNDYGALGVTGITSSDVPAAAIALSGKATHVSVGDAFTCVLFDDGTVQCFGLTYGYPSQGMAPNVDGGVAQGLHQVPISAGAVDIGAKVVKLATGRSNVCVITDTGGVRCWGNGDSGQLGYGNKATIGDDETPAAAGDVMLGGKAVEVAVGKEVTCAIRDDGKLICWGNGVYGGLGYGKADSVGDSLTPAAYGMSVPLDGAPTPALPVTIANLDDITCVALSDHTGRCWGSTSVICGYGPYNGPTVSRTPKDLGPILTLYKP